MYNLARLRKRYEGKTGSFSWLAFLRWGRKESYGINTSRGVMLNGVANSGEFKTNDKGQIQEFDITNESGKVWWGLTEDQYYPWPWFPDKKIVAFTCINICPGFEMGKVYAVDNGGFFINDDYVVHAFTTGLDYPEFFKPVYAL
jgi:hypothetical protein